MDNSISTPTAMWQARRCAIRTIISLASALALCPAAATAASSTLRFVTVAIAPWGITNATPGTKAGILSDIASSIAKECKISWENQILPNARALSMIESGDADLMMAFVNDRLKEAAIQVVSLWKIESVIFGRAGTRYHSREDLHGKTIAGIREANYDDKFTNDEKINKIKTDNYEQAFSMLLAGRVDGIIGVKEGLFYALRSMGRSRGELGTPLVLSNRDLWLYFSRKTYNPEIDATLRKAISRLQQKKIIKKIIEDYLESPNLM